MKASSETALGERTLKSLVLDTDGGPESAATS